MRPDLTEEERAQVLEARKWFNRVCAAEPPVGRGPGEARHVEGSAGGSAEEGGAADPPGSANRSLSACT